MTRIKGLVCLPQVGSGNQALMLISVSGRSDLPKRSLWSSGFHCKKRTQALHGGCTRFSETATQL